MKEVLLMAALIGGDLPPADDSEVLDEVVWLWLPETKGAFYPPLTIDEEFRGRLEFECRIRDDEGHLDCEVPQIDPDDAYIAKYGTAFVEQTAQVDMEKTPGAAVGKRVRLTVTFT
ncbi:hypothetical protein ABAC460_12245 [Asticcacaulis sp. AC460]|uniref:hypothetical protein n=1 Tax=Asticcacaulis sp. AC460 TaxID=1282360 RepID=UPI0003C4017F|nr:hypothetical protein [Asticcacaulis sp. AC460]ESQ89633.1 hypothetical protein ABAC460_12245 [Asticcacaulis sp. AC460]